jgi:hypothetical protein
MEACLLMVTSLAVVSAEYEGMFGFYTHLGFHGNFKK